MADKEPAIELGLVLAGAVSGGAYLAGVVDFLIEALDAWEASRASRDGPVPTHRVRLRVLSGASAGAMTSGIAARALVSEFEPARLGAPAPDPRKNRLHDAWVRAIDIRPLLGKADLADGKPVTSVLDSSALERIAGEALDTVPRYDARAYLADPFGVTFSIANLRGVPYGFRLFGMSGDAYFNMSSHLDDVLFEVSPSGGPRALAPELGAGEGWGALANAALASGAFPLGLRPRIVSRSATDYDGRFGRRPSWMGDVADYEFLAVDGGLMDNEPLELARRYLDAAADASDAAHRAIVLVDPFPAPPTFDADYMANESLLSVFGQMFDALKNQARFKPEELMLAEDEHALTRFIVSPARRDARDNPAEPAVAAAVLGGFGAFLDPAYRAHDYMLGRRNAQAFLRWHFRLPGTHPVFAAMGAEEKARHQVRNWRGETMTQRDREGAVVPSLPIVPLMGPAAEPVPQPPAPSSEPKILKDLEKLVRGRLQKVGRALLRQELRAVTPPLLRPALGAFWHASISRQMARNLVRVIRKELATFD